MNNFRSINNFLNDLLSGDIDNFIDNLGIKKEDLIKNNIISAISLSQPKDITIDDHAEVMKTKLINNILNLIDEYYLAISNKAATAETKKLEDELESIRKREKELLEKLNPKTSNNDSNIFKKVRDTTINDDVIADIITRLLR